MDSPISNSGNPGAGPATGDTTNSDAFSYTSGGAISGQTAHPSEI